MDLDPIRSNFMKKLKGASSKRAKSLISKRIGEKKEGSNPKLTHKKYDYDNSGKWTKERIIESLKEVLKSHGKISAELIRRLRKNEPEKYPAPATAIRKLGPWKDIKKIIGAESQSLPVNFSSLMSIEIDVEYFFELYSKFDISSQTIYREARKKYPEIVPPYKVFEELFGSFTNFKKIIKIEQCKEQIGRLASLIDNLGGKWPSKDQILENNIDMKFLDNKFGGRFELKDFLADISSFKRKKL